MEVAVPKPPPHTIASLDALFPETSAVSERLRIAIQDSRFYQESTGRIAKLLGHEQPAKDYGAAVKYLKSRYELPLSEVEVSVLTSLYIHTGAAAKRFSNDPYIDPMKGEDSAIHQLMCVPWAHEVMQRAGLFKEGWRSSPEIASMRETLSLGLLIHDVGEIAREFSALEDRSAGPLSEREGQRAYKNLEVQVAEFAIKAAFLQAQRGEGDFSFTDAISHIRGHAQIETGKPLTLERAKEIADLLSHWERSLKIEELAGLHLESAQKFPTAYHVLESGKDSPDSKVKFLHYIGKLLERCQGTRHLIRNCERVPGRGNVRSYIKGTAWRSNIEPTHPPRFVHEVPPPVRLEIDRAPSMKAVKNFSYNLAGVVEVGAVASSPAEKALAKEARRAILLSLFELTAIGPAYVDFAKSACPELQSQLGQLIALGGDHARAMKVAESLRKATKEEQAALFLRHREERGKSGPRALYSKSEIMRLLVSLADQEDLDLEKPIMTQLLSATLPPKRIDGVK